MLSKCCILISHLICYTFTRKTIIQELLTSAVFILGAGTCPTIGGGGGGGGAVQTPKIIILLLQKDCMKGPWSKRANPHFLNIQFIALLKTSR